MEEENKKQQEKVYDSGFTTADKYDCDNYEEVTNDENETFKKENNLKE